MLLKIIGIALVMVSTILGGLYYGSLNTYKINDLSEMKRALSILQSEIEFCLNPLPLALKNISNRIKQPLSNFFSQLVKNIQSAKNESISTLWEATVMNCLCNSYYDTEDLEQFISLGKTLGYLDKSMQNNSIRLTTEYIDQKISALSEGRLRNKKMFQSLGVLGGVLIVIVLL